MHAILKSSYVTKYFLPCAEKICPICLDVFKNPVRTKCGHQFCSACLSKAIQYEPYCPTCKHVLQPIVGKQPQGGRMSQMVCETVQYNRANHHVISTHSPPLDSFLCYIAIGLASVITWLWRVQYHTD